jgi:hypothetical protein
MPADDSLKRLGGGRWETRDGRFSIEPQSGTWVVVDNEQTDDLGLPLVRGPFGSLTAAKAAIEGARQGGPAESPLAERIRQAPGRRDRGAKRRATTEGRAGGRPDRSASASRPAPAPRVPEPPPPPPEPKWLRDLDPAERRRARELLERLERLDIPDADKVARAEVAQDRPALARLAIERALAEVAGSAKDPASAVRAAATLLAAGRDRHLDVRWRLVDDRGRAIDDLDPGV